MKNLFTYLKALWGAWGNLQSSDVSLDCRRSDLRRSPSGLDAKWKQNPFMRFAVVLTLIFTIGSGNVWGDSYTLTFKTGSGDGTSMSTSTSASTCLSGGSDYVTGNLATASNVYHSGDYGLKVGKKSGAGDIKINLSTDGQVVPTKVSVYAKYYSSKNIRTVQVCTNLGSNTATTTTGSFAEYSYSYSGSTKLSYIEIKSTGYIWVEKVVVTYAAPAASVATPTFSPVAGTYEEAQSVTISCATTGTTIYYTTDGSTPTSSSPAYSSAVSITGSCTLKAIAKKGSDYSSVGSAAYVIKKKVNWSVNGENWNTGHGSPTTRVVAGNKVTALPTAPTSAACDNSKEFVGWTDAPYSHASTAPSILFTDAAGAPNVDNDVTYYAVFATNAGGSDPETDTEHGKTSTPYVANTGWTASAGGTYTSTGNYSVSPSIKFNSNNHYVQSPTYGDAITNINFWHKNQGGSGYLKIYVSTDGSSFSELTSEKITLTSGQYTVGTKDIDLDYEDGYVAMKIVFSQTSGQCCIDEIAITYGGGTSYSDYATTCCTPLGSINGSVNLTTDGCGAGELKATWKMLATTGIASQTLRVYDENLEEVTAKRITGITASTSNQTKTISGLNPCKEYYVTVENVSSGGEYCAPGDPWESDVVTTLGYTLSVTKSNCSITSGSEPARICNNVSVTYAAATGYALPTSITVTNAGVQNSGWTWNSGTGVLTINKANVTGNVAVTITPTCVSPVITADPTDASYYVGDDPTALSVTATLASGTRTYLWKVSTDGGSVWSNADGTNNLATYSGSSLSTASTGTLKFKCIVGNSEGGCSVESGVATITVSNASYFPNGKTIFIQAESTSAWSDANYDCVKAWFHTAGGSETAQSTYWLFNATGGDAGKKLFATVVPATGDLPYLDIQRFTHDCSLWRNKNGGCSYSDANGSNTIRSTGNTDTYDAKDDYIRWNVSGVTIDLYGDPSDDDWASSLASFSDQGAGVWTATYENYAPANAAGESQDFKAKTNYNGWIGNTGSNNNATLDGMHVGSTYDVTATLDIKDHSLEMSKTFVKGTVHFNLQGHGLAISDLTNVTAGSKISAPSAPSATGYTFGGWYKEPACTNAWTFASDEVNETMTLYAKWTKHNYTITSTLNHCSSSPAIPSSYEYTGSAASLSYTITPSSGYRLPTEITVSGTTYTWNPATGALVLTGIITNNVTITISAVQTHTVDWYVGGSAPANKIGDDGQTTVVDHGGKISDFPATTPDGSACDKVFVGWTNTSSYVHGTSPLFNDVAGSPTINADAQFYAVFAEVNSVSASLTKMTADDDLEVGDKIVIIAQDTRYGMYQASASSYVSYWTTTDMDGEPSLSEIEADDKKYLDVAAGSASNTWKLGDATNGYLYNASSTNLEFSTTNSSDLTLITWTDDSFTLQAGQYISCRTDITGANANKWRGAGASCDPENDNNCSGTEYYYLYKYVPGGTTYTGHTINCADCGTSVTVSYSTPGSGNTMAVTKNAAAVASGSTVKTCTSQDLTVTLTPATHYDLTGFTATGLTTGTATITPAVGSTLPVSVAQTFTVTVSAGATGTLTLAPTFTAQTPLSITLETHSKGTFTPIGDIYSGESFTFPDVTPNDPSCATFVGWIEGTTFVGDGTTHDAPVTIAAGSSSGAQSSNTTYTAVFYETETSESDAYVKVTSTPANWANDHYLIVYEDGGVAFDGSRTDGDGDKIDAASNTVAVSITSSAIAATNALAASEWKIALISGSNYSIQSASGKYIGNASNSNALSTSSSALVNTLSISSGDFEVVSDGGAYLRYNVTSGQERFRYYKSSSYSSQQAIQLYKLGTAVVETRTYTTNPSCTPKYRVTVASVTGGSPSADPKYNPESTEVTITANPSAGYSFTEWRITKTTGGDNVTSTLLTGDKPTTASTTFLMPAYDVTVAASYAKKMVTELKVMDGSTVVANTTGPVSGTLNVSTGANKTLDVVITPSDAFDHSWTATVSAGSTYASITNVTAEGFRVNGVAQGDATITVTASNDEANGGTPKVVTFTVHVTDILPEEIILKRDGSNTPIETLIMYYDASESKGQYMKVNVSYSPSNPTNKAFTFSSAATGKVGSHSHSNNNGYEVLVANGVTTDPVNCTFTSSADESVTKVLAVTVLPILTDRFVDYIHGNATQTVSARLSADRYDIITKINTPSLSDASDAEPASADCETSHYHLIGWLPQATAEALWAAGTAITEDTEGLVKAGVQVDATGQTWCAIWAEEQ